mmetsp:Transcript_9150/g.24651  ORF Transcript_9150/g.24651 Transcript_9150/m.24651 type:complete len:289 (-) Transcript_9150:744-1610(-)|eukprot:CAMPEP_0202345794 /NCGR_PEP_ID=MMETSP1126-20121109/4874_1 /ASSEMBLY_ACC=CAM_ASM_000457 /TAXON_ID=3047 /ORGANISM="Dunaliella tertiolecta, Strain CCMP1320" /LENGTH=288 /DNA_ID=CAMNT_0048937137 /DNA_START=93 /DNA_END=959 /DNA_ORIENTATION=+
MGTGASSWLASASLELFPVHEASAVFGMTILIPLLRFLLEPCLFMPVARLLLRAQSQGGMMSPRLAATAKKMCESQWKLLYYSASTSLGVWATYNQPWLFDTKQLWDGWPDQVMTTPMRVVYMTELAYYLSTIVLLAFCEVPRKDYPVMMLHHFSTVALIIFTYKYNYARAACVVMLLHDINDVLMETAKILNYASYEFGSKCVFACFLLSWVVLRICIFPAYIIYSCFFEVQDALGFRPPFHMLLNSLMAFLYIIHIYWFALILKVAYLCVATGRGKDVREEDSHED